MGEKRDGRDREMSRWDREKGDRKDWQRGKEKWEGYGYTDNYSFKPLPLMKGCRWMT